MPNLKKLAELVEGKLKEMFTDAEVYNYDAIEILFSALVNGEWLEGKISINYITDLEVFVRYEGNGYFSYVGDIYWGDLSEVMA